ncbi:MAG: hypothetical protein MMC23_009218 [Stictis urceolatum]|nr:hypothetical protein [Stictis urceolata]
MRLDCPSTFDHEEQGDTATEAEANGFEIADSDAARDFPDKASISQKRPSGGDTPQRSVKRSRLQRRRRFSSPVSSETESESDDERASEYGGGGSGSDSDADSCFSRVSRTLSTSSILSVNTSAKHRLPFGVEDGSPLPLVGFLRWRGGSLTLTLAAHVTALQQSSLAQV